METPAAKRQRVDTETEGDPEPIIRSSFWFKDGNIVLQAGCTQFRVHGSMMARHSAMFNDMFEIPQPPQPDEPMVEGCPVIHMSDEAEDLEKVLSIFYDNMKAYAKGNPVTLAYLTAMLRLGKKYQIDYLWHEAIQLLRSDYPTALELWDGLSGGRAISDDSQWFETKIINLAQELSLQTVLPTMYLHFVSKYSMTDLLRDDLDQNEPPLNHMARKHLILGRERYTYSIHHLHLIYAKALQDITPECRKPRHCLDHRSKVFDLLEVWGKKMDLPKLKSWSEPKNHNLCSSCLTTIEDLHDSAREQVWAALPWIFGLGAGGGWPTLKDES